MHRYEIRQVANGYLVLPALDVSRVTRDRRLGDPRLRDLLRREQLAARAVRADAAGEGGMSR